VDRKDAPETSLPTATLGYGQRAVPPRPRWRERGEVVVANPSSALDATVQAAPTGASSPLAARGAMTFPRTTVLPRARAADVAATRAAGDEGNVRFEHLQPLGAGGVGEVVLVEDHDIDRKVAIKRLRPDCRSEPALRRFADEVRIVGQLEHPNIPPVHDVGVDEAGQPYFVMKYVEGETMEAVIARLKANDRAYQQRFTYEYRVDVFTSVLNAVHYAHSRGIVHRDLKPSNIMIGPYGEVTVMDWGIARRSRGGEEATPATRLDESPSDDPRARTQAGALLGTPLYMSPEQAAGQNDAVDERSDVYSLSLTFYEWMTLTHPLSDKRSIEAVLSALVSGAVEPEAAKNAFVRAAAPCEYAEVVGRGLESEPARRYQSVQAMISHLQAIRGGCIGIHCHITLAKRASSEFSHWLDRHPTLFTGIFASGVLGVGFAIWRLATTLLHAIH
jgi:serine/threonine-protein kinase